MNTASPASLRLEEMAAQSGLSPDRRALLGAAPARALPTARDENWKYASLRGLDRQVFSAATSISAAAVAAAAAALPARLDGFARVVFIDGLHCAELSDAALPDVATLLTPLQLQATAMAASGSDAAPAAQSAQSRSAGGTGLTRERHLSRINAALASEGLRIAVPPAGRAALEVVFIAATDGAVAASHPALQIELADGASLELVERQLGAGDAATFSNADVNVRAGRDSQLQHHRLQQLGPRSRHFETLSVEAGDRAQCEFLSVASGGLAARCTALVRLSGQKSSLAWNAVALADASQVNDAFVRVEHLGRGAQSRQLFRGIAAGRSRVAFNGHMIVREGASGAASEQSLRALLAGSEAEADLRPQLEIYIDEVRASHGATVGKLDEQMLFYLLSRGIGRATAEALLKWAFVADVVARIRIPALRRQAEALMAAQLRAVVDVGDLP